MTSFVIFLSSRGEHLADILFWIMGGLGRATWLSIYIVAPVLLFPGSVLTLAAGLAFGLWRVGSFERLTGTPRGGLPAHGTGPPATQAARSGRPHPGLARAVALSQSCPCGY